MVRVIVVVDGGSRGNLDTGFGTYAFIKGDRRSVTHLDFGPGMTGHEAEYDTLITALRMLVRQENPADISVEVRSASQLVINQLKGVWKANTHRLGSRRDTVRELLGQFRAFAIKRVPSEQIRTLLTN